MDNDTLVFLYKRELLTEDNDTINNNHEKLNNIKEGEIIKRYVLSPIEIVRGSIIEVDGIKVFYSADNKYELKLIDEISGLNDDFVYAFPKDITGFTDEDIKAIIQSLKEEEIYNTYLLQTYDVNENEMSDVFAYNKYSTRVLALINAENYADSLYTVVFDTTEYVKQLDEDKIWILRPKDVDMLLNEQKEEKKVEEKYETKPHKAVKYTEDYAYTDELYEEIRKHVINQDKQIRRIVKVYTKNQRIDNPKLKSNFILCGPTGVGKTEIFRQLANIVRLPMIELDATDYTAEGYVGSSTSDIITKLYIAADGDLKKAENAIVYIDEIDKKAENPNSSHNMDVAKSAVIQALLKMIEGRTYTIPINKKIVYFDTSRVTFAFGGAFSGIEKYAKDYAEKKITGFGAKPEEKTLSNEEIYNSYTLKKYGLLPEFVGRNSIIVMNSLSLQDLKKILLKSESSYLKLQREYFKSNGIDLICGPATIDKIVKKAFDEGTGARSLNTIIEEALAEAEFYLNASYGNKYKVLKITPKTIDDNTKFILR